jgi:hypothetical protein
VSTVTAAVLVAGALACVLTDHLLRLRRASRFAIPEQPEPHVPDTSEPHEEETRMSMSDQQLRTLGLSHVRRRVASGQYKAADVQRWKKELGEDAVQSIVDAAKDTTASAPAPASRKKATTTAEE